VDLLAAVPDPKVKLPAEAVGLAIALYDTHEELTTYNEDPSPINLLSAGVSAAGVVASVHPAPIDIPVDLVKYEIKAFRESGDLPAWLASVPTSLPTKISLGPQGRAPVVGRNDPIDPTLGSGDQPHAVPTSHKSSKLPAGTKEVPYSTKRGTPSVPVSAKGLLGKDFEDWIAATFGGTGSFKEGGREFDGAIGDRWLEAKSGNYWRDVTPPGSKGFEKFKSDMGAHRRVAKDNGKSFELHSNTPIPRHVKSWLVGEKIPFYEHLE
jgi:hypothetical protein